MRELIRHKKESDCEAHSMDPKYKKKKGALGFDFKFLCALALLVSNIITLRMMSMSSNGHLYVEAISWTSTLPNRPSRNNSAEVLVDPIRDLVDALSPKRLAKIAKDAKEAYASGTPFPHAVIDDIFPESILRAIEREIPEQANQRGRIPGNDACFTRGKENKKSAMAKEEKMGFYTRIMFSMLKSSTFIQFLEELSGIHKLIPDPHYRGSGIHITTSPGGKLDIHADFNKLSDYQLDRRVNSFVFLNRGWNDSYAGHLELWSQDMTSCYQRILPRFGRLVVFSTADFSYHGHPEPLAAPQGRARRSLALYFYTNGRPKEECLNENCNGKHTTLFQTPVGCERCEDKTCKAYPGNFSSNEN